MNTLGTGDRINSQFEAAGGNDQLEAQITRGSTYGDGNAPIQPRVNGVQVSLLEALQSDLQQTTFDGYCGGGTTISADIVQVVGEKNAYLLLSDNTEVFFNAKDVRGHDEIWSWRSDANLNILDLTTIVTDGGHDDARNTGDITIGMGYTGSDNTRWSASDLKVFFDPDFLLSGKANKSEALYFLLDEDADLEGRPPLDRINVDGIRFQINGGPVITLRDPTAQDANTHANFIAVLQDELAALKASGAVPADTTLFLDPTRTDFTFNDNGNQTQLIPAIVLKTNTAAIITPVGFSQVEDAIGNYDVYGVFRAAADEVDIPVSVQIALEKAGEGALDVCDGGALVVGAMDKYNQGIPVFNVTVYGDESRPSILRYLDSTGGVLDTINIVSDNTGFPTATWASLAIGATNEGLSLINAAGFKGDLVLGAFDCRDDLFDGCEPIYNLYTLLATGGGDVQLYGVVSWGGPYSYTTGSGNDIIGSEHFMATLLTRLATALHPTPPAVTTWVHTWTYMYGYDGNEQPNQVILSNVTSTPGPVTTRSGQKVKAISGSTPATAMTLFTPITAAQRASGCSTWTWAPLMDPNFRTRVLLAAPRPATCRAFRCSVSADWHW